MKIDMENKGYRSSGNDQRHKEKKHREKLHEINGRDSQALQELRFSRGMKDLVLYWRQLGWGHLF